MLSTVILMIRLRINLSINFFECICVMAYEYVAEGSTVKKTISSGIPWLVNNYPMKIWWREGILKFLPASKVPVGVHEVAERIRVKDKLILHQYAKYVCLIP